MMQHVTDDELTLQYYGDAPPETEGHLAGCPECRARFASVQRVLNMVEFPVPERAADYEAQVWSRLSAKLPLKTARQPIWRRWMPVAAMATVVFVAFLAGRYAPSPVSAPVPATDRVLTAAVGQHLERSSIVLTEIANAVGQGDIAAERASAEELLEENRLYRRTAATSGDRSMAVLLDELERVLLEIANSPDKPTKEEMDALRTRLERNELLFKVRVVGSQLRDETARI